jgi:hypothetical protein
MIAIFVRFFFIYFHDIARDFACAEDKELENKFIPFINIFFGDF